MWPPLLASSGRTVQETEAENYLQVEVVTFTSSALACVSSVAQGASVPSARLPGTSMGLKQGAYTLESRYHAQMKGERTESMFTPHD